MQQNTTLNDPFNLKYLLAILVTLLALPLMHPIIAWFIFL